MTQQQLAARRTDPLPAAREHLLDDDWYRARTPEPDKITVPVLSAANWFGQGLHGRGNFEGFTGAGSRDKWLEVHPGRHEEWFYLPDSVAMLSNGWLRVSHRKTDPARSLPYRPWHTHDERLPVRPGQIYPVDVEIWPTGMHLPAGYRLALTIGGSDFTRPEQPGSPVTLFFHTDETDRPTETFAGVTTLHVGPGQDNFLLTPLRAGQQQEPSQSASEPGASPRSDVSDKPRPPNKRESDTLGEYLPGDCTGDHRPQARGAFADQAMSTPLGS